MNDSIRLGRIAGVEVGLNWSLLVIFWLITWGLAVDGFPTSHPGSSGGAYWAAAVVTAVLFYGCLLAHELGHAVVARRLGMRVEGITLWLFGGVARLGGDARTPGAELRVGVVGPAVSIAAAAGFGLVALAGGAMGGPDLAVGVAAWLARINLVLGVFNLVPAYPLDGGRLLRALLWARHGDRVRATATAARAGRTFAYLLIGLGLAEFAAGGTGGGLWFVFLGWFLLTAARAEEAQVMVADLLGPIPVREVMSPDPVTAPASATLDELLDHALRRRFSTFPVVDRHGRLVGLVTLTRLKHVPPGRRAATTAGEVACPMSEVPVAGPGDSLAELVGRMAGCADGRALVIDRGRLVGIVSPSDVARVVELAALRDRRPAGHPARR